MKIEICDAMGWQLRQWCAEQIHAAVVLMHLRRVATDDDRREHPSIYVAKSMHNIPEIRALVRSIEDRWERREFVFGIGYRFKKLRAEHGTTVKWQNYVAQVEAYRAKEAA